MRLTDQQHATIRSIATETFGAGAGVWLFGSRVDDSKRGGDIKPIHLFFPLPKKPVFCYECPVN